ncbi:uncharacterized protein PV09_09230 [Verruconis gallopava]|uniref:Zn(2)-C6 fungal-type domain-containing protein n=1 Tax=Verruconis gallopava TaxID=253628 RepID=A0A0D2AJH0_9PEZI|nr:uncharacterized protein PV09_09230 [Verruconis gallopava]KIV99063.1 hypothetical protein PV09_09230 [Verruconis gallopava]
MTSTVGTDRPSSVACVTCRSKHLKCDGQMPTCRRCAESGLPCTFVKSRRGYQGRKRKLTFANSANDYSPAFSISEADGARNLDPSFRPAQSLPLKNADTLTETASLAQGQTSDFDYERLIEVYYRNIHMAHPIVLPEKVYLQDQSVLPDHLKYVMAFMASHLTPDEFSNLQEKAELVFEPSVPDDGFKVQALLLLTLTSYARFERDRGNKALTQAIALASRLGMDHNDFGHGHSLIYQESWRRTYWELYTITGLISLIAGIDFRIKRPDDLLLPGHCEDYKECHISELRDLRAMHDRLAMEDSFKWSSFAYKIEAMRILSSIFECQGPDGSLKDAQVQALSASISSYLLSLPEEKRSPVTDDGEVDEVMSCALMIINLAGVCLHFPRSSLAGKGSFRTVCGTNTQDKVESQDQRYHRAAAIKYANSVSMLVSSRNSLRTLTPCFSCSIAFAAAVHLSAILPQDGTEAQHKEHIQLELSALNVVASIWPIGGVVKAQLAQYSREVLSRRPSQALGVDSNFLEPISFANDPWLEELTSQYTDASSEGFLFNLIGPSHGQLNATP